MTTPITPLPPAPQRVDSPDDFITKSDTWVDALAAFTTETNALAVEVSEDAVSADTSALISASNANFVGEWGDQTGEALVPYSVFHNTKTWQLLNDLADVTLSEPGVTGDWVEIATAPTSVRKVTTVDSNVVNNSITPIEMDTLTLTLNRVGWWKYKAMLRLSGVEDANGALMQILVTGSDPVYLVNWVMSSEFNVGTIANIGVSTNQQTTFVFAQLGKPSIVTDNPFVYGEGLIFSSSASFDVQTLMAQQTADVSDLLVRDMSYVELEWVSE